MARGVGRTQAGNSVALRPCEVLPHWCLCTLRKGVFMLRQDKWMRVPSHVDGTVAAPGAVQMAQTTGVPMVANVTNSTG